MSLRVWLPLNGDLTNNGLSDLIFSTVSSNTTVNNNGKIGKCYNNNSNSGGGIISNKAIELGTNVSMCCWFKFTSLEASASLGGGLVSQHCYSDNTGLGITIRYVSSTTGYISCSTGTGSSRTYNTYYGTTLLQADTWYHAVLTYDGSLIKLYLNGILEKTQSYAQKNRNNYIAIFAWSVNNGSIHGDYKLNGYLNDVRIYDHALSQKEVKEISKGLVCHYKLDNDAKGGQENLFNWQNKGADIITLNNYQNTGSFTQFSNSLTIDPSTTIGQKYTISFWARSPQGSTKLMLYNTNSSPRYFRFSTTLTNSLGTDWQYFVYTFTNSDAGSGSTNASICRRIEIYMPSQMGGEVKMIKIENGEKATTWTPSINDSHYTSLGYNSNIVYDSSGYNYHGTKNGNLIVSDDSIRNSLSTIFDGTGNTYITSTCLPLETKTISCWLKCGLSSQVAVVDYNTHLAIGIHGSDAIISYTGSVNGGSGSRVAIGSNWKANDWNHIVVIATGSNTRDVYLNTVKLSPSSVNYWGHTTENLILGRRFYSSSTSYFNGKISDFRAYATALSTDDVKELYQTSASIDKSGNMFAYEFKED